MQANGGDVDQTAWMPFIAVGYVDSYIVRLLLQRTCQFELVKQRSVNTHAQSSDKCANVLGYSHFAYILQ